MIVTLWTGSEPFIILPTSACPASWYAVTRLSLSLMIIERRSGPIRTLSFAISKSLMSSCDLSLRAASSAASLTRFSRSAPEKPGVPRAMTSRSTPRAERRLLGVHREDAGPPADVGPRNDDAAIEAARAQQRRIEHVGAVGGGDQDDALVRLEAVHLDQQLVQRLLALVVTAAQARAAVAADGVDLVDEDDAGGVLLALLEQVAHAAGADAHEHLDEVRARDREERHARLARDRAREQRLAGSRRAHHQHALGDAAAEARELLRVLEEGDDLLDLVLRLLDAGDVGERHLALVLG